MCIAIDQLKIVYVCHSYGRAPEEAVRIIAGICRELAMDGAVPLAPQLLLPQFLDEPSERKLALRLCVRLIAVSDEMRVFGDPTRGMRLEIKEASRLGIPVVRCR